MIIMKNLKEKLKEIEIEQRQYFDDFKKTKAKVMEMPVSDIDDPMRLYLRQQSFREGFAMGWRDALEYKGN